MLLVAHQQHNLYTVLAKPESPSQYEKTNIAGYVNDMKVWTADQRKIKDEKKIVYALVMGQLSDSSRGELHNENFDEENEAHNLIFL